MHSAQTHIKVKRRDQCCTGVSDFALTVRKSAVPTAPPARPRPPRCTEIPRSRAQLLKTQGKPAINSQVNHLNRMGCAPQPLLQLRTLFGVGNKRDQRRHGADPTTTLWKFKSKRSKSARQKQKNPLTRNKKIFRPIKKPLIKNSHRPMNSGPGMSLPGCGSLEGAMPEQPIIGC